MAKQTGDKRIKGTIDDVTYYVMEGKYYARAKSSLTGRRVRKDPAFARTMQNAAVFATANKICSELYRELPIEQRGKEARYGLLRKVRQMVAEGKSREEIVAELGIKERDNRRRRNVRIRKVEGVRRMDRREGVEGLFRVDYYIGKGGSKKDRERVMVGDKLWYEGSFNY